MYVSSILKLCKYYVIIKCFKLKTDDKLSIYRTIFHIHLCLYQISRFDTLRDRCSTISLQWLPYILVHSNNSQLTAIVPSIWAQKCQHGWGFPRWRPLRDPEDQIDRTTSPSPVHRSCGSGETVWLLSGGWQRTFWCWCRTFQGTSPTSSHPRQNEDKRIMTHP